MRKRLFFTAFVLVGLLFLFNLMANAFYWYTSIFGFDKIMHFFGGVFLAFLVCALRPRPLESPVGRSIIKVAFIVFIIGLGWEFFEYGVQFLIKGVHLADPIDSVGDLIFDVVGGIIGTFFVILEKKRYNSTNE